MPAVFGAILILLGVLIIAVPRLLGWLVGAALIVLGIVGVILGLRIRSAVTYRRIDARVWPPE